MRCLDFHVTGGHPCVHSDEFCSVVICLFVRIKLRIKLGGSVEGQQLRCEGDFITKDQIGLPATKTRNIFLSERSLLLKFPARGELEPLLMLLYPPFSQPRGDKFRRANLGLGGRET